MGIAHGHRGEAHVPGAVGRGGQTRADSGKGEAAAGVDGNDAGGSPVHFRCRVPVNLSARRLVRVEGHPRDPVGRDAIRIRGHERRGYDPCVRLGCIARDQRPGSELGQRVEFDPGHLEEGSPAFSPPQNKSLPSLSQGTIPPPDAMV